MLTDDEFDKKIQVIKENIDYIAQYDDVKKKLIDLYDYISKVNEGE